MAIGRPLFGGLSPDQMDEVEGRTNVHGRMMQQPSNGQPVPQMSNLAANIVNMDAIRRRFLASSQEYDGSDVNMNNDEGSLEIMNPDGTVHIIIPSHEEDDDDDAEGDFYENLAEKLGDAELSLVSREVLQGIEDDERSRSVWTSTVSEGMDILGLKLEKPRADVGGTGAPMDGMSTVRHPMLLEACLAFQANAIGELLPAEGPVKVKNNGLGASAGDQQADQLEEDLNRFLTSANGAPEYYPDTDRLLFSVGFSGMGFKKLYHCPLRRRPVSESVDVKDLIVDNNATDLRNAARVTHRISMGRALMARMMFVGAYRDVELHEPYVDVDRIDMKIKKMQGLSDKPENPRDNNYTVLECYTDFDLPGFEHTDEKGRETGLPLPYKITIEKTSRKVLEIRRNWKQDNDDNFEARRVFVAYRFNPTFGFYASGLLHILGNTTMAMTGAWRIMLDSGMFSNFPGFIYALSGDRQTNLNFRIPPGGGVGFDAAGGSLKDQIVPLPYKDVQAGLMGLVENIVETGTRVGGVAQTQVGEGRQDAPVGTTIALIEQQTKLMASVHKRLHQAQSEEFQILLELFREDPDSLFRFVQGDNRWSKETLAAALNNYELQPVADPNVPTHMHRVMGMTALMQMADGAPDLINRKAVYERAMDVLRISDPESLFLPPQPPQAQSTDPAQVIAQVTAQTKQLELQSRERIANQQNQIKLAELQSDQKQSEADAAAKMAEIRSRDAQAAQDRQSREQIAKMNMAERIATKDIDGDHRREEQLHRELLAHMSNHAKIAGQS